MRNFIKILLVVEFRVNGKNELRAKNVKYAALNCLNEFKKC